jgi:hypothetical protein
VVCPLCRQRKARRACPALGRQICAICCGTKRLVEIACPSDCPYLVSAREHPSATALRRQQDDISSLVRMVRDLNERQSQLSFLVLTFLLRYQAPEFQPLLDEDVAEATAALAATYETAARGVIYEHRPPSLPAERLISALTPALAEAGQGGGTPFQRDAAVVLRRVEAAARAAMAAAPDNRRAFLDVIGRVVRTPDNDAREPDQTDAAPRVIIP